MKLRRCKVFRLDLSTVVDGKVARVHDYDAYFYGWGVGHDPYSQGIGNFSAAIVENMRTRQVFVVYAGLIDFIDPIDDIVIDENLPEFTK